MPSTHPRSDSNFAERRFLYFQILMLTITYLLVTACTSAYFMADTKEYVSELLGRRGYHNNFWDFGHLLWRPLAFLIFTVAKPLTKIFLKDNERVQLIVTLIAISWISGLACILLFLDLVRRVGQPSWVAWSASLGFLFSNAFLNYVHAGSPYVTGLAFLVAGMWLLATKKHDAVANAWSGSLVAAFCLADAVFLWFPYAFVVPAAAMVPLLIYDSNLYAKRIFWWTVGECVAIGLIVYVAVILGLGIHDFAGLKEWIISAGHGQMQARGLIRLAFSFPRAFINLGQDGVYFKRYLVHDPYAPVSLIALFKLSLWKIAMFYLFIVAVGIALLRSKSGRRMFLLLAAASVPLFVFALFIFEAGSIERYLPLCPFIFLAAAYALQDKEIPRWATSLIVLCLLSIVAVDGNAMRNGAVTVQRDRAASRIRDLQPRLTPSSVVMTVDVQEDLSEFKMNFPLDPINARGDWRNYNVLEIGAERLANWREDMAKQTLATWAQGGDVWISERFFAARPRAEWNWVEGDDKRIRWTDLPAFFSEFDTGELVGGVDGFVLLPKSPKNERLVSDVAGTNR